MDRSRFPPEKLRKRARRGPLPAALKINKASRKIVKIPIKTLQHRIPLLYLISLLADAPPSPVRASTAPTQEANDVVQPHTCLPGSSTSLASDNPSSSVPGRILKTSTSRFPFPEGGSLHYPGIPGSKNSGESSSMADAGQPGNNDSMDDGFMRNLVFTINQNAVDSGRSVNNPFVKEYYPSDLLPNFDKSPTSPDMAHFDPDRFLNDDI